MKLWKIIFGTGKTSEDPGNPIENPIKLIKDAVWSGDLEMVERLLKRRPDLVFSEVRFSPPAVEYNETLLHIAAEQGQADVAELLLANGADVNAKGRYNMTPMDLAVEKGHESVAQLLRRHGGCTGSGRLFDDVRYGDLEKVKLLLDAHPDLVFRTGDWENAPLHIAAGFGHKNIVELLLAKGADACAMGHHQTPLHVAASFGHKNVAELLLAKGVDVDVQDVDGRTPLHEASEAGHKDIAELLLANGANVNAVALSETPLHEAAKAGHRHVAELLLAKGADVNAKGTETYATPLHLAARSGHKDVAELLLSNGAHINARVGRNDWTPLHEAANLGRKEVAELLLAKGADINAKGRHGETPLDVTPGGFQDLLELLRQRGAESSPIELVEEEGD